MKEYKEIAKRKGEVEYEMSNRTKYRMVVYEKDDKLHPFATNTGKIPIKVDRLVHLIRKIIFFNSPYR